MNDLQHFEPILSSKDIISQPEDMKPHLMDWRGQFDGAAQGVLFPRSTEQVAQIWQVHIVEISSHKIVYEIRSVGNATLF